jgi:hypothetical protein
MALKTGPKVVAGGGGPPSKRARAWDNQEVVRRSPSMERPHVVMNRLTRSKRTRADRWCSMVGTIVRRAATWQDERQMNEQNSMCPR